MDELVSNEVQLMLSFSQLIRNTMDNTMVAMPYVLQ
jgi:hypothetical protein